MSEFESNPGPSDLASEPGQLDEARFLEHVGRVAALVRGEHLPEAELEVLRALNMRPTDLRGLKLLALVRFKRGRYAEAREVYEVLARTTPDDASVRLSLGLIALKMDWAEEAVAELEVAARLGESSPTLWSHLGYAYERLGRMNLAADAFRRAGQGDAGNAPAVVRSTPLPLRAEPSQAGSPPLSPPAGWPGAESGFFKPSAGDLEPIPSQPVTAELEVEGFAPADGDDLGSDGGEAGTSLTSFVLGRLLDVQVADEFTSPMASLVGEVLRFSVSGETHVRANAVVAVTGALNLAPAQRRERGRLIAQPLADAQGEFLVCDGRGEMWLAPATETTRLIALSLQDDLLFIRQSRVVAFDQDMAWESGRLPGDDLELLQLRGTGRVVLDVGEERFRAFKVPGDRPLWVQRGRLLGWVGRMVPRTVKRLGGGSRSALIACEGEGVLLLSIHGLLDQPTDERAKPGDDGPGAADSRGAPVHR